MENLVFHQIGVIKTPYTSSAPYQPVENDDQEFYLDVDDRYVQGLKDLDSFNYIYVIYYIDRLKDIPQMLVAPPWAYGRDVGVFASRSPDRPNPIGLSVVRIRKIFENRVYTSGLDVFDGTPLLDIKPYIKDLDSKIDANHGWIEASDDAEHLALHIQGIPHDY
jgi:tRNA-Thr(GGU) m(6)t(6)A37 methyltransferase TsaA